MISVWGCEFRVAGKKSPVPEPHNPQREPRNPQLIKIKIYNTTI